LKRLQAGVPGKPPVPTAFIDAIATPGFGPGSNYASLDCTLCAAQAIRLACGTNPFAHNPLALNLTPNLWNTVFGVPGRLPKSSDAIVPATSETNDIFDKADFFHWGVIHSPGLLQIDFTGPYELGWLPIGRNAVDLLNTPLTSPFFRGTTP
jgi:hypothetical protein